MNTATVTAGATRELTISEQTTEDLKSQLETLARNRPVGRPGEIDFEVEAIELELEERDEREQKVSRW